MLQVRRKPRLCGISVIFFQCCFMSETQLLMIDSDFFFFFSRNHFLKGAFTFQLEGDFIFKCVFVGGGEAPHGGISFDGGRALKKVMKTSHAPHHVPHYRKPYIVSTGN